MNPSLGAWPRHPCRGHPRQPIRAALRQTACASATEHQKKSRPGPRGGPGGVEPRSTHAHGAGFAFSFLHRAAGTPIACQRLGEVGLRGCKRHGWRARAYRDVFTAPPAPPTHPANLQKAAVRGKPQPRGAPPMAADRAQRLFPPESSNHALAHGLTTQLMTTLSPPGAGLSPRPPRYPVRPLRRLPGRRPDLRHARRHRGPRAL